MGPVVPVCCHSAVRAWHAKTPPGMHGVVPVCCHSTVQGGTDDSLDGVATCVLLQCGAGWDDSPCWDGVPDRAVAARPGIISSSATPLQLTMDGLLLMPPSTASCACMRAWRHSDYMMVFLSRLLTPRFILDTRPWLLHYPSC